MDRQLVRFAGVAGIVFAVLIMVANVLPGSAPAIDNSASELREYWVDNRDELLIGSLLSVLATPLFFWFLLALRDIVRRIDGDGSPLAALVLVSGTVLVVLATVGTSIGNALVFTEGAAESASDDLVRAVWDASVLVFVFSGTFFFLMIGSFSLAVIRRGGMPTWLGWVGAALAVVGWAMAAVGSLDAELSGIAFIGFLGFMVWTVMTGVVLLARPGPAPAVRA